MSSVRSPRAESKQQTVGKSLQQHCPGGHHDIALLTINLTGLASVSQMGCLRARPLERIRIFEILRRVNR
jgi:hypothetical protein